MCIETRKKIFALLQTSPGMSVAQICQSLNAREKPIAADVKKLFRDEVIRLEKIGRYSFWYAIMGAVVPENKRSEAAVYGYRYGRMCDYHRYHGGVKHSCLRCQEASDRATRQHERQDRMNKALLRELFPVIMS